MCCGLEIPIKVSVTLNDPEKLSILMAKVKEVDKYVDEL